MLLIACEHSPLAQGWQRLLSNRWPMYEVVAQDRRQLEICLKKNHFDAAIIHLPILGTEGVNTISAIQSISPETKLIIMSTQFIERDELSAVIFGAKAYLHDQTEDELLVKVVAKVLAGEVWVDRKFVTRLLEEIEDVAKVNHEEAIEIKKGVSLLTPRETQIAELISTGSSNRTIAENLSISERTVKAHLGVIFKKIGITDRLQLALYMNKYHQLNGSNGHEPN